jgi:hypothetical protein
LENRASNPVSVKNLTAIETSMMVKLLRPYVPVGTKRTRRRRRRRRIPCGNPALITWTLELAFLTIVQYGWFARQLFKKISHGKWGFLCWSLLIRLECQTLVKACT